MTYLTVLSRVPLLKLLLIGALATGVVATATGRGTLAFFTTRVTSTANTFTAGDLHFQIGSFDGSSMSSVNASGTSGTTSASITLSDIKPGDTVFAPLSITNAGSLDARWGVKYTTTHAGSSSTDLANALQLGIVGSGESGTATTACKSGSSHGFDDTTDFPEQILALGAMAVGGTTVVDATNPAESSFGTFASGDNSSKSLAIQHGTTEVLCLQVYFPDAGAPASPDSTAGDNAWNGTTNGTYATTLVFTFDGRQMVDASYPNPEFDENTGAHTGNH